MLNSFQLKLVKFTLKKWTEQKQKKLCKHTMSLLLLKQDRRNNNKNSKQKLQAHHVSLS